MSPPPVEETRPPGSYRSDDTFHLGPFDRARVLRSRMRPRPESEIARRHEELGLRKGAQVSGVVVVQVGDDDPVDRLQVDLEPGERLDRRADGRSSAPRSGLCAEAGVHEDRPRLASQQPEEVVHAQWRVGLAELFVAVVHPSAGRHPRPVPNRDRLPARRTMRERLCRDCFRLREGADHRRLVIGR